MTKNRDFDDALARIVREIYPAARKSVVEAETAGKMRHPRVWLESIRNGLDDLAAGIRLHLDGQLPEAIEKLKQAEWHFVTGGYEAWIRTATKKAELLRRLLRAPGTRGNVAEARRAWQAAQTNIVDARTKQSNHDPGAESLAKQAAIEAIGGIDLITPSTGGTGIIVVISSTFGAGLGFWFMGLVGGLAGAFIAGLVGITLTARGRRWLRQ